MPFTLAGGELGLESPGVVSVELLLLQIVYQGIADSRLSSFRRRMREEAAAAAAAAAEEEEEEEEQQQQGQEDKLTHSRVI